jgi:hypothetical protein
MRTGDQGLGIFLCLLCVFLFFRSLFPDPYAG